MMDPSTLSFLKQLARNNDKSWFDAHRPAYEKARDGFEGFVAELLAHLSQSDPELEGLKPRSCIFRINRDVRFSKNKSPYKTHFGASLSKGGRASRFAGYYFHLEPGACFLGGGLWMPEAADLARLRQEIDYCLQEFDSILKEAGFRKTYGALEQEHRLTRIPKGYESDNPAAEHLKLKSFVATRPVADEEVVAAKSAVTAAKHLSRLTPLIRFINRALEDARD